jgi:hypothetical protein
VLSLRCLLCCRVVACLVLSCLVLNGLALCLVLCLVFHVGHTCMHILPPPPPPPPQALQTIIERQSSQSQSHKVPLSPPNHVLVHFSYHSSLARHGSFEIDGTFRSKVYCNQPIKINFNLRTTEIMAPTLALEVSTFTFLFCHHAHATKQMDS